MTDCETYTFQIINYLNTNTDISSFARNSKNNDRYKNCCTKMPCRFLEKRKALKPTSF